MPDFKVSTQIYSVECGFDRLGMGREDEYFWKTAKERKLDSNTTQDNDGRQPTSGDSERQGDTQE